MNNVVLSKISIIILAVVGILGLYMVAGQLLVVLMPFIMGLLISKLINRPVTFLHEKIRIPRGLGTLATLLGFLWIAGLGIYHLVTWIISLLAGLSDEIPLWASSIASYFQQVTSALESGPLSLSGDLSSYISQGLNSLLGKLGDITQFTATKLLDLVSSVPNFLFITVIIFVSAFFFTKDREKIQAFFRPFFKGEWTQNEKVQIIRSDVLGVLWGYLKAQLILMSVTFVLSSIGLMLIGVSYPIPIALGIAIVDALPILGPATVYVPWAASKLIVGQYPAAASLLVLYLVVTLSRQALEPKILSTQIGIYPLVTLLSMYMGLRFIGFPGIILGPVTVIIVMSLFKTGIIPPLHSFRDKTVPSSDETP